MTPPHHLSHNQESERVTRKTRIDPRLKQAQWPTILPYDERTSDVPSSPTAIEEWPTENGPADYALCANNRILGVVEAKKLTVGPGGVLTQAERYSKGIAQEPKFQEQFGVPFLYSTNGEIIRFHDVRNELNLSRELKQFHTPAALQELSERDLDSAVSTLTDMPFNERMRPYQVEANLAIEQAIANRKRKMLVTMATGTGKTMTMVNETYRLMKSGAATRVLFLVDRKALAAQTVRAFASFEAEPGQKFDKIYSVYSQRFQTDPEDDEKFDANVMPNSLLTNPKPGDAFVYVSTIQRMTINLFGKSAVFEGIEDTEDDAEQLNIPIHAFDLIIADECHRGYSSSEMSVWRDTLDYFDAVKVGLTATPAAHTMAYFDHLAYRYDYERAVREGYLVDYNVVRVRSDVRMNGVFLKEGEQVDIVNPESGAKQLDLLEDERSFDASTVERKITAPDSNRKIIQELKRHADEHQAEYGRFPKMLIFAVNDLPHTSHADQLVELCREAFGQGEGFVTKITGRVDRPLQRIREFRNRKAPGIAVTVDLLTTGVDIPDLEYLVFLRPVKSRILFEQMLGRGTRKGQNAADKSHFTVFDCFDGTLLEYFRSTTGMTIEPPETHPKKIEELVVDIWQNRDRAYNTQRLVKRLQRIDKEMSGDARELFAAYLPNGDLGQFAGQLPTRLKEDLTGTLSLLRDDAFLKLLTNYPRPGRTFIVAQTAVDTVTSEIMIKGGAGQEFKPADYLIAFDDFITDHADEIEAVRILLNQPHGWGAEPLKELRTAMLQAPEHFTVENLQHAYKVTKNKALVDIISMVKRAALDTSELFTAEERVNIAVERIRQRQHPTPEQQQWLDYIQQHLVHNLSIERDDFEHVPVLSDRGGWNKANRVFDGRLPELIQELNEELVAA